MNKRIHGGKKKNIEAVLSKSAVIDLSKDFFSAQSEEDENTGSLI